MGAHGQPGTPRPSVVTIGNFDGVHVGHRRLIAEAMRLAERNAWRSVALTFDRHPATIVRPGSVPPLLTDPGEKLALLAATGIGEVVVLTFDEERASEPAEDFVREFLVGTLGARAVVVGSNFRFGHLHRGDVALLGKLGSELGFEVTALHLVADDEGREPVSSSRIRALIGAGDLEHAAALLGRPHQVRASVVAPEAGANAADEAPDGSSARSCRAVVEAGLCLPPDGSYEGWVAAPEPLAPRAMAALPSPTPTALPGRAGRLELHGRTLSSDAFARFRPGETVEVALVARASALDD